MIGQNINAYFDAAMMYPVERLEAVIRGQDKSIPAAAAMMALPLKQREVAAAVGMQAMQQPQQPSIRQQMAQATMPQMAPQSPQGMRQIPQQSPQQSPQQVAALPENTGLMNLPAPNMNKMADGGIVAFDDGGTVDHYDDGGTTSSPLGRWWDSMTQQDVFREQYLKQQEALKAQRDVIDQGGLFGLKQQTPEDQAKYEEAKRKAYPVKTPAEKTAAPAEKAPAPKTDDSADAVTAALKTYGTPTTEKKKAPGIGGIPKTPTAPARPSMSYEDYVKQVGAGDKDILAQYAKAGEDEATGMKALLAEREKNKPQGKAGDSMEKYLAKREAQDTSKRAENINMAFVNAGLGIAAGNSQHWMQNVATGSKEAIKEYRAGIDKLDAAADERAKLMSSIEDARRAEAKGDWKELYSAQAEIEKSKASYRKAGIDAIVATTGATKKAAADMFTADQTNQARLEQTHIAGKYQLAGDQLKAAAYGGGRGSPLDRAVDNANTALKAWAASQEGRLEQARDTTAYAKKERALMAQHFKLLGLPDPYSVGIDDETRAALAQYRQKS